MHDLLLYFILIGICICIGSIGLLLWILRPHKSSTTKKDY